MAKDFSNKRRQIEKKEAKEDRKRKLARKSRKLNFQRKK